jgi:LmbE family N-acetylglucosaminyl deacetylase
LVDLLRPVIQYPSFVVAPWSGDPHPDHEACGRAARRLADLVNVDLVFYLFWAWHRVPVESIRALPLVRFELEPSIQTTRTAALRRHRSQLEWETGNPILPASLLRPAQRSFETFISHA